MNPDHTKQIVIAFSVISFVLLIGIAVALVFALKPAPPAPPAPKPFNPDSIVFPEEVRLNTVTLDNANQSQYYAVWDTTPTWSCNPATGTCDNPGDAQGTYPTQADCTTSKSKCTTKYPTPFPPPPLYEPEQSLQINTRYLFNNNKIQTSLSKRKTPYNHLKMTLPLYGNNGDIIEIYFVSDLDPSTHQYTTFIVGLQSGKYFDVRSTLTKYILEINLAKTNSVFIPTTYLIADSNPPHHPKPEMMNNINIRGNPGNVTGGGGGKGTLLRFVWDGRTSKWLATVTSMPLYKGSDPSIFEDQSSFSGSGTGNWP